MTHAQRDTFEYGIGVLAAGNTTGEIQENDPIEVNGVALPVGTVVEGGQEERHFYTEETLRDAAELLEGQNIVKNFHEIDGQAPADDVIGQVTSASFSEGLGLVYEGEIIDEDIAQRVAQGYLDVSPTVARALGEYDEARDARQVDAVAGFRDLAVVQNGQPGADIEIGPNPAVEALSLDALSRAMDADGGEGTRPENDTMSLEDAKETLAEEYEVDVDELDDHLDSLGDDPGDDGGGGELNDDQVVELIEQ